MKKKNDYSVSPFLIMASLVLSLLSDLWAQRPSSGRDSSRSGSSSSPSTSRPSSPSSSDRSTSRPSPSVSDRSSSSSSSSRPSSRPSPSVSDRSSSSSSSSSSRPSSRPSPSVSDRTSSPSSPSSSRPSSDYRPSTPDRTSSPSSTSSSSTSSSSSSSTSSVNVTPRPTVDRGQVGRRSAVDFEASDRPISSGRVSNQRNYQRNGNGDIVYRPALHRPTQYERVSPRHRFSSPSDYTVYVINYSRSYIYDRWLFYPSYHWCNDGYWFYNNYDYYVYQGYRYRYSDEDYCNYDLIDTRPDAPSKVIRSFERLTCKAAYDQCATARDQLIARGDQWDLKDYLYCAESVEESFANPANKVLPTLTSHLSQEQLASITAVLRGKSEMELFKMGSQGKANCKIVEVQEQKQTRCNYEVKIGAVSYPQQDGSICSNKDVAASYGCSSNSQMKIAGCLFALAVREGLCL